MRRRTKKESERFIAHEFLEFLCYDVRRCVSGADPGPDIVATVKKGGRLLRLGIELTDYQVDASPSSESGSPGRQAYNVWSHIRTSIRRRVAQIPGLAHTCGSVFLKRKAAIRRQNARCLAGELVAFAKENPLGRGECGSWDAFPCRYPLLRCYVSKVTLRDTGDARLCSWHCPSVSCSAVGIDLEYIADAIAGKNCKAKHYVWGRADERWLLICAPGSPVVCTAGPRPENKDWQTPTIGAACAGTPFTRIYFWERMNGWCKPVFPEGDVIRNTPA